MQPFKDQGDYTIIVKAHPDPNGKNTKEQLMAMVDKYKNDKKTPMQIKFFKSKKQAMEYKPQQEIKQPINEIRRMQQLAGVINENQFYGDFDENSVRQMLIGAGKDPQEVDNFMDDEEGYFTWSNMTFNHQPTNDDIKNAFVDAFEEWATGGTESLYEARSPFEELGYQTGPNRRVPVDPSSQEAQYVASKIDELYMLLNDKNLIDFAKGYVNSIGSSQVQYEGLPTVARMMLMAKRDLK